MFIATVPRCMLNVVDHTIRYIKLSEPFSEGFSKQPAGQSSGTARHLKMGSISDYVETTLPYWPDRPAKDYVAGTMEQYRVNFENVPIKAHDMRLVPETLSVDVQGFQLVTVASPEQHIDANGADRYSDTEYVKSTVFRETEDIIRSATGASRVHCYSHLVRRRPLSDVLNIAKDKSVPDSQPTGVGVPSPGAHIDHSHAGSAEVLRDNLGEEEARSVVESDQRWAIINLWRPIKTVRRDPLVLCDARSVAAEDIHPTVS
jgi:hypothetical protein